MKALVAGFGNIFFGDDGFGPEAIRALGSTALPEGTRVKDFGIGGMHAAFEMIDGYDFVLFLDAVRRGDAPGTLYVIEPRDLPPAVPDAHAMELHNALAFYDRLCEQTKPAKTPKVLVIGCEPQNLAEGMGLSGAMKSALGRVPNLVLSVLQRNGIGAQLV
jgi:hydrogenase maturation protease